MEKITTWMGIPLPEVPRDELEREFIAAHERIIYLEDRQCQLSVEHINLLAELAMEKSRNGLLSIQHPRRRLVHKIFDVLFGLERRDELRP